MIWKNYGQGSKIRQQTLQLAGLLARWCQVREDLLYAFEKSLETGVDQPMRQCVEDFLTRVRGGMTIEQALDQMQHAFEHEHFRDLIMTIRFNFRYRGDLPALLENMEWQLERIEEEYARRHLSNVRDRNLTVAILIAAPLLLLGRSALQPAVGQLVFQTQIGLALLIFSGLATAGATAFLLLIMRKIGH
jgi:Flp pilus assembly protein TadB